jgi:hypothetical protein
MLDRVRIGGLDVQVVEDETVDGFGEWWSEKQIIRVAPRLPDRTLAATLLHEALHAVGDAYGVSLPERLVRVLEQSLISMVRADPAGARRWLEAVIGEGVA